MMNISTIQLSGCYTQTINIPSASRILSIIRRDIHEVIVYTLIYEYDSFNNYTYSDYDILFNDINNIFSVDERYKYINTVEGYPVNNDYYIVHAKRILTDSEKRELKIDHLLNN